ncbi:MAG: twin-arginine translocase TatA/TatE family subunit [Acidimicrobiales bacterium]
MPSIGATELIIVLLVVLLLFGSTKLPKLARSIGEASKEFKKGVNEPVADTAEPAAKVEPTAPPTATAPATAPASDDSITMSRADLDALLAEREARARKESPPPA